MQVLRKVGILAGQAGGGSWLAESLQTANHCVRGGMGGVRADKMVPATCATSALAAAEGGLGGRE